MDTENQQATVGQEVDPFKDDKKKLEKIEEEKLKKKYPNIGQRPRAAGSQLLQKRLQKGTKYFDSGDYNMAMAKCKNKKVPAGEKPKLLDEVTGETIPTPENVPVRKTSINTHPQVGMFHSSPPSTGIHWKYPLEGKFKLKTVHELN